MSLTADSTPEASTPEASTPPTVLRRRRITGALVGAVSALLLGGVTTLAFRDAEPASAGTSTAAASFALPTLDGGGTVRLADYRGKPVVVNLFASWCDVCDVELPGYAKLARELDGKVQFVGVASLETGDPKPMIARNKLTGWPLARDAGPSGRGLHDTLAPGFGGMPITAFYDADGKLLEVHRGGLLEDDLRAKLRAVYGR